MSTLALQRAHPTELLAGHLGRLGGIANPNMNGLTRLSIVGGSFHSSQSTGLVSVLRLTGQVPVQSHFLTFQFGLPLTFHLGGFVTGCKFSWQGKGSLARRISSWVRKRKANSMSSVSVLSEWNINLRHRQYHGHRNGTCPRRCPMPKRNAFFFWAYCPRGHHAHDCV
jgi:hypothetical protein